MDCRIKSGNDESGESMPPPVFRFAPSPNGYLHLGHAFSALLNSDLAHQAGGRLLLRIEDIDVTRCKPEFQATIYEDLAWLGIAWETPVRRQLEHLADYREALEKLSAQGIVYPSFETRAEIAKLVAQREASGRWPRDPDGAPLYPGTAKWLSSDERTWLLESDTPYALRLDMAAACARAGSLGWREHGEGPDREAGPVDARPEAWGAVILARQATRTRHPRGGGGGRPGHGAPWPQNRAQTAPRGRGKGGRRKHAPPALPRTGRASASPCPVSSRHRSRRSRMRSARRSPEFWPSVVCWRHPISTSGSGAGSIPSRPVRNTSPVWRHCSSMRQRAATPRPVCGRTSSICGYWRATPAIRLRGGLRRKVCNPKSIFRKSCRRL